MTDRLRASLSSYFARHMNSGDWVSCLKALHGSTASGTPLRAIPFEKLLPFLLSHGQWEAVLGLGRAWLPSDPTHAAVESKEAETQLCAHLLRAAVVHAKSWPFATALVQRAMQRGLRLPTETLKETLAAVEPWQRDADHEKGVKGGTHLTSSSDLAAAEGRRDAIRLMCDLLAADLHRRVDVAARELRPACDGVSLQSDLIDATRAAVHGVGKDGHGDAALSRLQAQLQASFTHTWMSAVYTVLSIWYENVENLSKLPMEIATPLLDWTLKYIFDRGIISPPPAGAKGRYVAHHSKMNTCTELDYGPVAVAWWKRMVEQNAMMEIPKWEAVARLAIAQLEQREAEWKTRYDLQQPKQEQKRHQQESATRDPLHEPPQEEEEEVMCESRVAYRVHEDTIPVWRLLTAARLALTRRPTPNVLTSCETSSSVQVIESALRMLLLHGGLALTDGNGVECKALETALSTVVESLLHTYAELCSEEKAAETSALPSHTLEVGRALLWDSVLFPDTTKPPLCYVPFAKRDKCVVAWQSILRLVFHDARNLTVWFKNDKQRQWSASDVDTDKVDAEVHRYKVAETSTHNVGNRKDPESRGRRRHRHAHSLSSSASLSTKLDAAALSQLMRLILFLGLPGNQTSMSYRLIPGLSELLVRVEDLYTIGESLFSSNAEICTWRLFLSSLPQSSVTPLLRHVAKVKVDKGSLQSVAHVTIVALMHEFIDNGFPASEATASAEMLLQNVTTRTEAWRVAMELFNLSPKSICQQHKENQWVLGEYDSPILTPTSLVDSAKSTIHKTTVQCVLNTLVRDTTVPRWSEALQVVETLQRTRSFGANRLQGEDQYSLEKDAVRESEEHWTPLSETERIDLYETIAPMRERRHWRAALELLDTYRATRRKLGPSDLECFAFAVAIGPLEVSRQFFRILGPQGKCKGIAHAALVAAARQVKRFMVPLRNHQHQQLQQQRGYKKQQQDSHKGGINEGKGGRQENLVEDEAVVQERLFTLYEAARVAELALNAWPKSITDESDFAFIWGKVRNACARDDNAARLMMFRTGLYDAPLAKTALHALVHEVALCHSAHDSASAAKAYRSFREHFAGMIVPDDTMLQLLELCETAVHESGDGQGSVSVAFLCSVLQDALSMHDISSTSSSGVIESSLNKFAEDVSNDFLHAVCAVIFHQSPPSPHTMRLLRLVIAHVSRYPTHLACGLPELVNVISRLLPCASESVAALTECIHTLLVRTQSIADVPVESLMLLRVLQACLSIEPISATSLAMENVTTTTTTTIVATTGWDPTSLVLTNDESSFAHAKDLLEHTIGRELDAVLKTAQFESQWTVCATAIEVLPLVLSRRYHGAVPLTALLAAVTVATRWLRSTPREICDASSPMRAFTATLRLVHSFQSHHTASQLALAATPSSSMSITFSADLRRMANDATRQMCFIVHRFSSWALLSFQMESTQIQSRRAVTVKKTSRSTFTTDSTAIATISSNNNNNHDRGLIMNSIASSNAGKFTTRKIQSAVFTFEDFINSTTEFIVGSAGVYAAWRAPSLSLSSLSSFSVSTVLPLLELCRRRLLRVCESLQRLVLSFSNFEEDLVSPKMQLPIVDKLLRAKDGEALVSEQFRTIIGKFHDSHPKPLAEIINVMALLEVGGAKLGKEDFHLASQAVSKNTATHSAGVSDAFLRSRVVSRAAQFGSEVAVRQVIGPNGAHLLTAEEKETTVELTELIVFASLADPNHAKRMDVCDFMERVGAIAPCRWDLACALALCSPLTNANSHEPGNATQAESLRQRLAISLQSCGSWPPGMALSMLLFVYSSNKINPMNGTEKVQKYNMKEEYPKLLTAMVELDASRMWNTLTPGVRSSSSSSSSNSNSGSTSWFKGTTLLHTFVSQQQNLTTSAAALLLGNLLTQIEDTGKTESVRQHVFMALFTSSSSVQYIVLSELTGKDRFFSLVRDFALWLSPLAWYQLPMSTRLLLLRVHACRPDKGEAVSLVASSRAVQLARKKCHEASWCMQVQKKGKLPLLHFPLALFTTAQFGKDTVDSEEVMALRLASQHHSTSLEEGYSDKSLFMVAPTGFTSMQYAYAVPLSSSQDRRLLLLLACGASMAELADSLAPTLESQSPMAIATLRAAWNVILIRRTELAWEEYNDHHGSTPPVPSDEPLTTRVAGMMLFALTASSLNSGSPAKVTPTSFSPSAEAHDLMIEVLVHSMENILRGGNGTCDELSIRTHFETIAATTASGLQTMDSDTLIKATYQFLKYSTEDTKWLSFWPPLALEMTRCRDYIKHLLRYSGSTRREMHIAKPCIRLQHPLAVVWMMRQQVALAPRLATVHRPNMKLLHMMRSFIESGVAIFSMNANKDTSPVSLKVPSTMKEKNPLGFRLRGTGAGIVVDAFLTLILKPWPTAGNKRNSRDNHVVRHVVDALFPRGEADQEQAGMMERKEEDDHNEENEGDTNSIAFLLGYVPVSRRGLQSLAPLLVLRDGLDRRRTATVEHVVSLLQLEQQRRAARCIVAKEIGMPLSRVHIGHQQRDWDLQVLLLFFLRAFVSTLTITNPLGWHGERQSSLDMAYTTLIDFMRLRLDEMGETLILSRAIRVELEHLFGPNGIHMIYTATTTVSADKTKASNTTTTLDTSSPKGDTIKDEDNLSLRQLLNFFNGNWIRPSRRRKRQLWENMEELLRSYRPPHARDVLIPKEETDAIITEYITTSTTTTTTTNTMLSTKFSPSSAAIGSVEGILSDILTLVKKVARADAMTPSPSLLLSTFDLALEDGNGYGVRTALHIFILTAPFTVVSTRMLESVLALLVALYASGIGTNLGNRDKVKDTELVIDIMDLILRRLQYVPLNTPVAISLLFELYAIVSSEDNTINTHSTGNSSSDKMIALRHALIWRCAVESSRMACAILDTVLATIQPNTAAAVQRGCLAFLLQDHSRIHYDSPFVYLGSYLDTLLSNGDEGSDFASKFILSLESTKEGSRVPWRRLYALLFQSYFLHSTTKSTVAKNWRVRMCVLLLERTLPPSQTSTGLSIWKVPKMSDGLREMWKRLLGELLQTFPSVKKDDTVTMDRLAAVLLRAIHIAQPPNEWLIVQELMQRVVVPQLTPAGKRWWRNETTVVYHTMQYIIKFCDATSVPLSEHIFFLKQLVQLHTSRGVQLLPSSSSVSSTSLVEPLLPEVLARRVSVITSFTQNLHGHPYLCWDDAITLLGFLDSLDKTFVQGEANETPLQHVKDSLFESVMCRLYRRHAYEDLLRFVEAAQLHHCRVRGREPLEWLTRAASIVIAPTSGLTDVLQLLTGTSVGKTLDDILREQSNMFLEERAKMLQDLLLTNRLMEAAAVARQTPPLLHSQEFQTACLELSRRGTYESIVRFYDELLHSVETEQVKVTTPDTNGKITRPLYDTETQSWVEDPSLLTHLPYATLLVALEAFVTFCYTSEDTNGNRLPRVRLFVTAAWIRQASRVVRAPNIESRDKDIIKENDNNDNDHGPFSLTPPLRNALTETFRWARDAGRTDLQILSDAVRDAVQGDEKIGNENHYGKARAFFTALFNEPVVTRLLVQTLSGAFPASATMLCQVLLRSSTGRSVEKTKNTETETEANVIAEVEEWTLYLRSTAMYNASLTHADMHCRVLLADKSPHEGQSALLRWRDAILFRNGDAPSVAGSEAPQTSTEKDSMDTNCPPWVESLTSYCACRMYIGHSGAEGAHAARLTELITASGSLSVALRAARDAFLELPSPSRGDRFHKNQRGSNDGKIIQEAILLLSDALCGMKRQTVQLISSWSTFDDGTATSILREVTADLSDLNLFVRDAFTQIVRHQRQVDYALDSEMIVAAQLIRCLTVAPSIDMWRSTVHQILAALSPSQRYEHGISLRDAVMESARHSFELLHALKMNPIHSESVESLSESCHVFWRDVFDIVVSPLRHEESLLGGDMFAVSDHTQRRTAMKNLETLIFCASLAGNEEMSSSSRTKRNGRQEVISAMRVICDLAMRRNAIPLTEESKALIKMCCIRAQGPAWRGVFEELTGFAPTTARRVSTLSKEEESSQQRRLQSALDSVSDAVQGMKLLRDTRETGARLKMEHYRRILQILEIPYKEDKSHPWPNRETTVDMGGTVMELHFAMLQDGVSPATHMVEQSLRLLRSLPLQVLQYAQALTLLLPVTNRRHRPQKQHLHRQEDEKQQGGSQSHIENDRKTDLPENSNPMVLSTTIVELVTNAALQLPTALRQLLLTRDEAHEGLSMLAAFVNWACGFSRIPCLERRVMESIVALLCANPDSVLDAVDPGTCSGCEDAYTDLFRTMVAVRGGETIHFVEHMIASADDAALDKLYFTRGQSSVVNATAKNTFALAALQLVYRQVSAHHTLHVSAEWLVRLFAASSAGMEVINATGTFVSNERISSSLHQLSRLAKITTLVSPRLRQRLALAVAEQTTLWHLTFRSGGRVGGHTVLSNTGNQTTKRDESELQASHIVRVVSKVYQRIRLEFSPSDASALSELLAPKSSLELELKGETAAKKEKGNLAKNVPKSTFDATNGEEEWEKTADLFEFLIRNAQPHADLTTPFTVLMEQLCDAGQSSKAVRYVALATTETTHLEENNNNNSTEDLNKLLRRHVVVDCFVLRKLVDTEKRLRGSVPHPLARVQTPQFGYMALRLLWKELQNWCKNVENVHDSQNVKCIVPSVASLAVMKDIRQELTEHF